MPKAFPLEFRRDVVAVARKHQAPLSQIAKDFGVSKACLHRWLKMADVEDDQLEFLNSLGCGAQGSRAGPPQAVDDFIHGGRWCRDGLAAPGGRLLHHFDSETHYNEGNVVVESLSRANERHIVVLVDLGRLLVGIGFARVRAG